MKRWQRLGLAVAGASWLVGCLLRLVGRLPGSWWLWAAPYWLVMLAGLGICLLLALSNGFVRLVGAYQERQDRRDEERVRQGILRSLEADFLRGTGISVRLETDLPPPGNSTLTIFVARPPQPDRRHES